MTQVSRHDERTVSSETPRDALLSVSLFDIDHFERGNDNFGQDVGDTLRSVAVLRQDRLRSRDILARFGGEEVVAVLNDPGASDASVVAQSLINAVADTPIDAVGTVTISCGVAQLRLGPDDAASLMHRADQAL